MPRNVQLLLAYDGTEYCGWERQKEHRSLQQTLEKAIYAFTGETVNVVASGRTDSGVHAIGQVANFHTCSQHDCETIRRALNALLPDDFRVLEALEIADSFHATYAAAGKMYRYCLHDGPVIDPILRRYVVHVHWPLDGEVMHRASQVLLGTHDFSSFETAGAPRGSSVRTITQIAVVRAGPEHIWSRLPHSGVVPRDARGPINTPALLYLEVSANGFLYNMVRAIAGTLINVGRGFWSVDDLLEILNARDRTRAGPTAAPHGLYLVRVDY